MTGRRTPLAVQRGIDDNQSGDITAAMNQRYKQR